MMGEDRERRQVRHAFGECVPSNRTNEFES